MRPALRMSLRAWLFGLAALSCREETASPSPQSSGGAGSGSVPADVAPMHREVLDLLDELPHCEVRHRGLSIDTGSAWADAHRSFQPGPFGDVKTTERAGHGSGRVLATRIEYDFWLDRATRDVRFALRAQGERATVLSLYVDGARVGDVRLDRTESKVFEFGPLASELAAGRHVVTLRWNRAGDRKEGAGLLDWIRVYLPDNREEQYSPPTAANLLADVELSGQARRSLSMRPASSVRCPLVVGKQARVQVDVGYSGEGEGVVEVRALLNHDEAVTLAERKVVGGEDARFVPLDLSLDAVSRGLFVLEFSAVSSTGSGRLVFGEPRLVRTSDQVPANPAETVVVVVVSGLARDIVPPWGDRKGLRNWFEFSEQATSFEGYRISSTLVGNVVATLLSGLPGSEHGVLHSSARVSSEAGIISTAMRQVGGRSAFFTNVPYTFEAFGLARDFNRFEQMSPVADLPADEPLTRARAWLEEDVAEGKPRRRFLLVHVRGGHPPFDVTPDDARALPPAEYSGVIEPRRAAIILRTVRDRQRQGSRKLGPKDWERLVALQRAALIKQDAALGALWKTLKSHGLWDQSLIVLMGDVPRGEPPMVPFEPHGELREDRANPPLLVKFPGGRGAGRSMQPFGTLDLSYALYRALGLRAPSKLAEAAPAVLGGPPLFDPGVVAVHPPSYVYSLGRFRMSGAFGEVPTLCDLEVDPACQQDLYAESPFVMEWLWRLAFRSFGREGTMVADSSGLAAIDEDTRAALTVYGL